MPRIDNRTVQHLYTGETISFLDSADESLLIEVTLPAGAAGPPLHYHDRFTEEFTVIEGELAVTIQGTESTLTGGDSRFVPLKQAHTFNNRSNAPVRFRVKLAPGDGFEQSVRIHYGLMDDGLTDNKGTPKNILHTLYILHLQNTFVAGMPLWLQRGLSWVAISLGKLGGSFRPLQKYLEK